MPVLDFFRNLFGVRRNHQEDHLTFRPEIPRQENDSFRNPIWETEDDDDEYNSDFRNPNEGGIHFQIFGDPFEMTRYFESQMDSIFKNFFDGFGGQRDESPFEALPAPPESRERTGKTLRERILLREFESPVDHSREYSKADSDLDGKISAEELSKVWKEPSSHQIVPAEKPRNSFSFNFSKVNKFQIVNPDGTVEKRQTFKDSNGNERTVITRQMGEKIHEIITTRDKDGSETKTENLINMDENEMKSFYDKWKTRTPKNPTADSNQGTDFPWQKLFGPEPKL